MRLILVKKLNYQLTCHSHLAKEKVFPDFVVNYIKMNPVNKTDLNNY